MSNGSLNNNAGGELDYMEKMRGEDPTGIDSHAGSSGSGNVGTESDKSVATASKRSSKSNHVSNAGAPRDASRKGRSSAASGGSGLSGSLSASKDELICKMESDIKKLKVDLQLSRNKENDLRDQIVSFMTGKLVSQADHYWTPTYSGGQLKWDSKNVSFCVSATTKIMKTNNVPLKSPRKLLPEMKNIFLKCSKFVDFKDFF